MNFVKFVGHCFNCFFKVCKGLPSEKVVDVDGFKVKVYPQSGDFSCIHKQLFWYGNREYYSVGVLKGFKEFLAGGVVLDIGANIGVYSLLLSRLVGCGSVVAVEPFFENFKLLVENIVLNNVRNVHPYSFAFGSEDGFGDLFVSSNSNWCNMVSGSVSVPVTVRSVDSFLCGMTKFPVFVRMDVEGFESEILKGMDLLLSKYSPVLMVEYHKQTIVDFESFYDLLSNNGYYAKFVVFETKVKYPYIIDVLLKGVYPLIYKDVGLDRLFELCDGIDVCPNIFFVKKGCVF